MNDVENIGSISASSELRTPVYANFEINTSKVAHFIDLMAEGVKGSGKNLRSDLSNKIAQIEHNSAAARNVVEYIEAYISGIEVFLDWIPVMVVTTAEAYLMDVLVYAAGIDPTLMERSEQSASYSELTNASSLEEVITELRYRWARNFLEKGGPRSWVERLTKMGARAYNPKTAEEMETFWGLRHLIVHSAGIATSDFTRRHPHFRVKVGERVQVGLLQVNKWLKHISHFVDVTDAYFVQRCRK